MNQEKAKLATVWGSSRLFELKDAADNMSAYIPAKSQVSRSVAQMTYEDFCEYFTKKNYHVQPTQEAYDRVKKVAASPMPVFPTDFPVLLGIPASTGEQYKIKWLTEKTLPKALVVPGMPFLHVQPTVPPRPATTIHGQSLSMSTSELKLVPPDLLVSGHFRYNQNNEVISDMGGTAYIEKDELKLLPHYKVESISSAIFQQVSFPCDVIVTCDLEGQISWVIDGNLTVEGYWSTPTIEVFGNAHAKGGVHTNVTNEDTRAITIHGSMTASFIELSRLKIDGRLTIERSISTSIVKIDGDLICAETILGCEISTYGSITADKVGSEKNAPTVICFENEDAARKSKINTLAAGTKLIIGKNTSIIQFDRAWPEPPTVKT